MRKHYNPDQPHISEDFVKLNQAFLDCGAVEVVMFGDAKCLLCDAQKVFRVVRHVLAPDPECLVTKPEISAERWKDSGHEKDRSVGLMHNLSCYSAPTVTLVARILLLF